MNTLIVWAIRLLADISSTEWGAVLQFVIAAEERITEGTDKKAWVLDKLQNLGIKGSVANFLVESGVAYLKRLGKA